MPWFEWLAIAAGYCLCGFGIAKFCFCFMSDLNKEPIRILTNFALWPIALCALTLSAFCAGLYGMMLPKDKRRRFFNGEGV